MEINFLIILIFHNIALIQKSIFTMTYFSPKKLYLIMNQKAERFPFQQKIICYVFILSSKTPSVSDH